MTALLRILFLVPLGYILACIAAGFMMAFGLFGYEADPESQFFFTASVFVWTFWAGAVAFLPAIVAIILAEAFGWRSILYWLAVGGGIALAADRFDRYGSFDFNDPRSIVLLAAGFVGGFAYWLIAGRLAGTGSESAPAQVPARQPPPSGSPPEQA